MKHMNLKQRKKKGGQQRILDLSALAPFDNFHVPDFGIRVQHRGLIWQNKSF